MLELKEKRLFNSIMNDLLILHESHGKEVLITYLNYMIIFLKNLDVSKEFMEKLYFIRYYIDKVENGK